MDIDANLSPRKKISKAITQMILTDPFFGALAMGVDIYEDVWGITDTMVTNGSAILFNSEFVKSISVQDVKFVMAHEVVHIALKHHLRCGDRDMNIWNDAADYATNALLEEAGYNVMQGAYLNQAYKGMAAEQIYAILEKQKGKGGKKGSGKNPQYVIPPRGSNTGKHPGLKNSKPGGVINAPINMADKKAVKQANEKVDLAIEAAAKTAGSVPGAFQELVDANKTHKLSYAELLADFLSTSVFPDDFDWMKPDLRFFGQGYDIYIPGVSEGKEKPKIVLVVDTSGSVGPEEKRAYANEISGVLEEFYCEILCIYVDTVVQHTQTFDSDNMPISLEAKGGGGTNFRPAFEYMDKNNIEAKAVLFFTDLATSDFGDDPGIPVLWMNTYRGNDDTKVPFGKVIKLDLD